MIEATGVTKVAEAAIDAVKRRGKLLLFGVCPPGEKASYDAFKIYNEEISILGSMAVLNSYGPAIDILSSGAIDTERMVTDTFPIDQFPEALARVRGGQGLKVQVAGTSSVITRRRISLEKQQHCSGDKRDRDDGRSQKPARRPAGEARPNVGPRRQTDG